MCISSSNLGNCNPFVPFTNTTLWTLPPGSGPKAVFVHLQDALGDPLGAPAQGSIALDDVPPAITTLEIVTSQSVQGNGGNLRPPDGRVWTDERNVSLVITGSDDYSSVTWMCISNENLGNCNAFVPYENATSWALAPGEGVRAVYVTLKDAAGNAMANPASALVYLDTMPPTNASVSINGDAPFTNSMTVVLNLGASDLSGVRGMCISQSEVGGTCTGWEPFAPQKTITLTNPDNLGQSVVRVFFRDAFLHATPQPVAAGIRFDGLPPSMPGRRVRLRGMANGNRTVTMTWDPAASWDVGGSGVAGYVLMYARRGMDALPQPPVGCALGAWGAGKAGRLPEVRVGPSVRVVVVDGGFRVGERVTFRLCAVDVAGNRASGVLAKVKV